MAYNAQQQAIIDEATRRAQANGSTPEMEAWKYAQSTGMNPNQVDQFFGWNSGTTGNWAVQNGQMPAPQGNFSPNNPAVTSANLGLGTAYSTAAPSAPAATPASGNPTTLTQYTQNPYLPQMAQGITQQMTDNWTRNLAPSIRSGAMAAGGFGGSRQGVVEANGLRDLNTSLGQNLTNLYGTDYNNQMNRNMQQYQTDTSANLGYANLDSNNAQFGANYGLNALNAQNTWALNGVNAANQIQNTPIDYNRYFSNQANQTAGQGGTTTQNNQGNPYMTAIGGAMAASRLYG